MQFRTENEMVGPATDWLRSLNMLVKNEFATPWGVCDLVGCRLNEASVATRLAQQQRSSIGPELRVSLLLKMPDQDAGRGISFTGLARGYRPYVAPDRIAWEVEKLVEKHFAVRTRTGSYKKVNGWIPLHDRLVAIELKLSRVSEALEQAVANREFADESFVGLPVELARRAAAGPRAQQFCASGIGIVGVAHTRCELLLCAGNAKPTSVPRQVHAVERFWRDYRRLN